VRDFPAQAFMRCALVYVLKKIANTMCSFFSIGGRRSSREGAKELAKLRPRLPAFLTFDFASTYCSLRASGPRAAPWRWSRSASLTARDL
jgi:hypothetical protein